MLHGFPEYSGAWEEVSEYFSDSFYCLPPDQRGYGKSYSPERVEDYKMELLIQDLKGIIKHFGGPLLILGHDWVAAVAYGLAIAYPELVSRINHERCTSYPVSKGPLRR